MYPCAISGAWYLPWRQINSKIPHQNAFPSLIKISNISTRWAPTSFKWSYKPYIQPYKWVTGVIAHAWFMSSRSSGLKSVNRGRWKLPLFPWDGEGHKHYKPNGKPYIGSTFKLDQASLYWINPCILPILGDGMEKSTLILRVYIPIYIYISRFPIEGGMSLSPI